VTELDGHLVLLGLMGVGKSTVGRVLARRLACRFLDSDEAIADRLGTTASGIADRSGLAALHRLEADVLHDALRSSPPAVIAAAASVVDDRRARSELTAPDVTVVWLRGGPAVLARRAAGGAHRPLGADPLALLAQQHERRSARFGQVADLTIDTDDRSPPAVADAVMRWLSGGSAAGEGRA
jgi:shikimate kinase